MPRRFVSIWLPPLLGAVIGLLAAALFPGRHALSRPLAALLGAAGAWSSTRAGLAFHLYPRGRPAAFFMAALGAIALVLLYSVATH